METMGVRGIWGLEQLERTGISTLRCGLILIGVSMAVSYLTAGIELGVLYALFFGSASSASLWAALALSRATQADVERFLPFDDGVQASIHLLQPPRRLLLVFFLFSLAFSWAIPASVVMGIDGLQLTEFLQLTVAEPETIAFWYINLPFVALTSAILVAVIVGHARALSHAARHLDIDVLRLDQYPHLANPLLRILSYVLIVGSLYLAFSVMIDEPGFYRILLIGLPFGAVSVLIILALYAYPVWLLKGRIHEAKQRELRCVLGALSGDDGAMIESRLRDRASGLTISELLDYRSFIESLWDWPVAPHIQRVFFFGMLPPLTWVLAGMVENAVGAIVGLN